MIHKEVRSVGFGFYDEDEIRKLSVKKITSLDVLNNFGQPMPNGLLDEAMGPTEPLARCKTCGLLFKHCPGHIGHIELCVPLYHPLLMRLLANTLKAKCFFCHHLKHDPVTVKGCLAQLCFLKAGRYELAEEAKLCAQRMAALSRQCARESKKGLRGSSKKAGKDGKKENKKMEDEDEDEEVKDPNVILERGMKRLDQLLDSALQMESSVGPENALKTPYLQQKRREVVRDFMRACPTKCQHCGGISPKIRMDGPTKIFLDPIPKKATASNIDLGLFLPNVLGDSGAASVQSARLLFPNEARAHMKLFYQQEYNVLSRLLPLAAPGGAVGLSHDRKGGKRQNGFKVFFCPVIMVPPNKFRPMQRTAGATSLHAQNALFNTIQKYDHELRSIRRRKKEELATFISQNVGEGDDDGESSDGKEGTGKKKEGVVKKEQKETKKWALIRLFTVADGQAERRFVLFWLNMQDSFNILLDSDKNRRYGVLAKPGVRQLFDKKRGLFRQNMMGKRVNHAARSVISPDPYILANEIGVPERFARQLTYNEPVTQWNAGEMASAVENGPFKHPGANYVLLPDGGKIDLSKIDKAQRVALANTLNTETLEAKLLQKDGGDASSRSTGGLKVVCRHLRDGDFVLMNRQPTLHKPSIMAHKARVLKGTQYQTIRMHYANCKTFNADFDGDEMNMHFPQSELARAEAQMLANTDNQYVKPTDGTPLRGLIQDHVDAGVLLSSKNCFFTRAQYQQLLYQAVSVIVKTYERVPISCPTILKPAPLWTGKQLMSDLIKFVVGKQTGVSAAAASFNMDGKPKLPNDIWGKGNPEENVVRIRCGDLLTGVLDKAAFGNSKKGLVDNINALFGGKTANLVLSLLGRLFTKYIQTHGFTCGLDDLLLTSEADQRREKALLKGQRLGIQKSAEFVGLEAKSQQAAATDSQAGAKLRDVVACKIREQIALNAKEHVALDNAMKTVMGQTTTNVGSLTDRARRRRRREGRGAGSFENVSFDIVFKACLPAGQHKPFPSNMFATMVLSGAKGSKVNHTSISCLLGQQELEGRRVPLMMSGRTLPSFKPYDPSPRAGGFVADRFLTGLRPQEYYFHCMAGREGRLRHGCEDVEIWRCLVKHLEGLQVAYDYTVRDTEGTIYQFNYGGDSIDTSRTSHLYRFDFLKANFRSLLHKLSPSAALKGLDIKSVSKFVKKAAKRAAKEGLEEGGGHRDPVLAQFAPGTCLGAVSEKFRKEVEEFCKALPKKKSSETSNTEDVITRNKFRSLMFLNYISCLAHPVTLGIPRLREIVMTASRDISTPIMELPLLKIGPKGGYDPDLIDKAKERALQMSECTLSDVLDSVRVRETIKGPFTRYQITMIYAGDDSKAARKHMVEEKHFRFGVEKEFILKIQLFTLSELGRIEKRVRVAAVKKAIKDIDKDEAAQMNISLSASHQRDRDDVPPQDREEGAGDGEAKKGKDAKMGHEIGADHDDDEEEDGRNDLPLPGSEEFERYRKRAQEEEEYDEADADDIEMVRRAVRKKREEDKKTKKKNNNSPTSGSDGSSSSTGAMAEKDLEDDDDEEEDDDDYDDDAAREAIVYQIGSVFGHYGINVDKRHLGLLADYMTHDGGYRPLNRLGIEGGTVSPFQKITYETSTNFLLSACVDGSYDHVTNPSSRIVMGIPPKSGTGAFDLRYHFDAPAKRIKERKEMATKMGGGL
eukprot:jgi/Bigna1/78367/fgenesh1_pg.54_\